MKKVLVCFSTLFLSVSIMAAEEPKYRVLKKHDVFELREYSPIIVAEARVIGAMSQASSAGFRLIADYIFGNNTTPSSGSRKIAMTVPVTMQTESEAVDMTAPVSLAHEDGHWRVHFVMPSNHSIETLPQPNNPRVELREIPERKYGVIRFSGIADEQKVAQKTAALLAWLEQWDLSPQGAPELARYNHPATPPFMRRNEVMVQYSVNAPL
ncbi:SOUL heme-binding protein [Alteromonadaceae bacterium Bs31]|nr:SOUL heme-binding protein [Alteromonadaceae bacterium Bs31]